MRRYNFLINATAIFYPSSSTRLSTASSRIWLQSVWNVKWLKVIRSLKHWFWTESFVELRHGWFFFCPPQPLLILLEMYVEWSGCGTEMRYELTFYENRLRRVWRPETSLGAVIALIARPDTKPTLCLPLVQAPHTNLCPINQVPNELSACVENRSIANKVRGWWKNKNCGMPSSPLYKEAEVVDVQSDR